MEIMANPLEAEVVIYFLVMLLLLTVVYIISKNLKRSSSLNALPLPPGPTPWPILGNIPHMGKNPHISLANFAHIHGPLISLKLGTKTVVVASSPSAAMEILKTNDRSLSGRYAPLWLPYSPSQLNQTSIVFNEECSENWKQLRALCKTELFSGKALESQECLREKKAMEMVDFLKGNEDGKVVNIGFIAYATMFNTLGHILLSRDLISLHQGTGDSAIIKDLLREIADLLASSNLSDLYPFLSKLDVQGLRKKAKKVWQTVDSTWAPLAEQRRMSINQTPLDQRDFMDTLVHHGFSGDGLIGLLMELFTAGSDTNSVTVEWMMTELVKNPEAMKNLREELDREINQDVLKESQLIHLPYLQACFKETMRLHAPVPLLVARRALESCQIMNYTIPKNAQVLVNVWAIGRDPKTWEEPLKFTPERFLNSSLDFKGNHFELLPFGGGRRICPGLPMAARQVPLIVASLIRSFDWSLPQGQNLDEIDMNEKFGLSLQKEQPLLLIPQPRK